MSQLPVPAWLLSPLGRRTAWVLFAIVFYLSGESAMIWLFDSRQIDSPWRWAGVLAFPLLLLAFFRLQRFFGCRRGACTRPGPDRTGPDRTGPDRTGSDRMTASSTPSAVEDHPYSPPPG